jgi:hypothetical protein
MSARDHQEYVRSLFGPLVTASGRTDLIERLRTLDIPPEQRRVAFERFRKLEYDGDNLILIPNGDFITQIKYPSSGDLIAVSVGSLTSSEIDLLEKYLLDHNITPIDTDAGTLLVLAHQLRGLFQLRDEMRIRERAENFLDITDDSYAGHEFAEVAKCYRPIRLFSMDTDNAFSGKHINEIALRCLSSINSMRPPLIDSALASEIAALQGLPSIDPGNLVSAITTNNARHLFLEIYRCIERNFGFSAISRLNAALGGTVPYDTLSRACREHLRWREKEVEAIEDLFEMIESPALSERESAIPTIRNATSSKEATRRVIGRTIYKVRNALVHAADRDDPTYVPPDRDELKQIASYLAAFTRELCQRLPTHS